MILKIQMSCFNDLENNAKLIEKDSAEMNPASQAICLNGGFARPPEERFGNKKLELLTPTSTWKWENSVKPNVNGLERNPHRTTSPSSPTFEVLTRSNRDLEARASQSPWVSSKNVKKQLGLPKYHVRLLGYRVAKGLGLSEGK